MADIRDPEAMSRAVRGQDVVFHLAGQMDHVLSLRRRELNGATIPVFGDGTILRDFLYVDDCVEAILLAAGSDTVFGEVLNVGGGEPTTFREVAETLSSLTGARWEFAPFSPERKAQEPGDFYSDVRKIARTLGWRPRTPLREGLERTLAYYREARARYW